MRILFSDYKILVLVAYFVLFIMFGCATSEESLLMDLKSNPDNVEAIAELAEYNYKKNIYDKAFEYYKKLEKLNSINDAQKYRMYIAGTRVSEFSKESWAKIDSLRNTDIVKYKRVLKEGIVHFTVPEHWIVFIPKIKAVKPYSPMELKIIDKIALKKGKNEGLIYCGLSFMINYSVTFPKSFKMNAAYYTRYYFPGLRKQLLTLLNSYKDEEAKENIQELQCYVFQKTEVRSKSGETLGFKIKKVKISREVVIDDDRSNIGYVTYLKASKKRYIHIIYIGEKGNSRLSLTTQFEEELLDNYMEEIDKFCRGINVTGYSSGMH